MWQAFLQSGNPSYVADMTTRIGLQVVNRPGAVRIKNPGMNIGKGMTDDLAFSLRSETERFGARSARAISLRGVRADHKFLRLSSRPSRETKFPPKARAPEAPLWARGKTDATRVRRRDFILGLA